MDADVARIAADPRYVALVRRRGRLGALLSGVVLAAYFGFVALVAFAPQVLARPVGAGVTSLGIPIGVGIILLSIALTALYVARANGDFDAALAEIRREHGA